jgi:hypothetical protein
MRTDRHNRRDVVTAAALAQRLQCADVDNREVAPRSVRFRASSLLELFHRRLYAAGHEVVLFLAAEENLRLVATA